VTGVLAVVNPASAGGATRRRWPAIRAALREAGVDAGVHLTTAPGDATEAVRAALVRGCGTVLAVGGDGQIP